MGNGSEISRPLDQIAANLDYSFRRLINIELFQQLLDDPSGRLSFRQAILDGLSSDLSHDPKLSLAKLDLWLDCKGINHLLEVLRSCSLGLHGLYVNPNSTHVGQILPSSIMNQLTNSIRAIQSLRLDPIHNDHDIPNHKTLDQEEELQEERREKQGLSESEDQGTQAPLYSENAVELKSVENYLLRSLYRNEFPLFIKKTLISNVRVKLGRVDLNDASQDGMGECFCLTNPRLRDHPIVLVSDGFTKVTGYERHSIVGKNCRFLQGPGTSPESIQRIRDGLNSGEGCTELLLNYRSDGTPFYCLLTIIPFRDATGALIYFIGGQINVTGMLSSKKGLSFLMTDPNAKTFEQSTLEPSNNLLGLTQYSLSQNMREYSSRETCLETEAKLVFDPKSQAQTNSTRGDHNAAGSITFDLPAHDKYNSSFPKRLFRRLAGINTRDQCVDSTLITHDSPMRSFKNLDQKLVGAEGWFHDPKPLDDHMKNFETVYSQLLVFKRNSRQVIFATKEVIDLFGLNRLHQDRTIFNSKLLQHDFIELIWPLNHHDKSAVSELRNRLKEVIKCGVAVTLDCQIKVIEHKSFFSVGKDERFCGKSKPTKIHLTPVKDRDGNAVAFTCLFGPRNLL